MIRSVPPSAHMFDNVIKSLDYQRSFGVGDPPHQTIRIVFIFCSIGKGTGLATPARRQAHWGQPL